MNRDEGKMIRCCLSMLLIFSLVPGALSGKSTRKRVKEGNGLYAQEKYDQALNKYQDALLSNPENKRIQFNVGNTLYQKKKYEEALKEYYKVIGTKEIPLEQQTYFNLGNTLYRLGKLPESILAYQQALKLNPNDMDAKYNLEYVRRKLKQNAQKQPLTAEQQQQMQQEEAKRKEEQEKEHKDQEDQPQPQPQEKQDQKKLTKEEAERILDALKNDEKNIQKKRKMKAPGKRRVKKDW